MYKKEASYGSHRCSCRRKRLNEMHYNRTKPCTGKTKKPTYSACTEYAGKPTYPSHSHQMSKPTYHNCSDNTGYQIYSSPLIMDETFTKPSSKGPSQQGQVGCGCTRCQHKRREKRYICHCYECN